MDFAVSAFQKVKQSENINRYLARTLKKLRNMIETVIPIIVGSLGTFHKRPRLEELEIGGIIGTIQNKHC